MTLEIITAAKFKAQCLKLMDYVNEQHTTLVITKHGTPVAKLIPIAAVPIDLFGALKGNLQINGDIMSSLDTKWDAES